MLTLSVHSELSWIYYKVFMLDVMNTLCGQHSHKVFSYLCVMGTVLSSSLFFYVYFIPVLILFQYSLSVKLTRKTTQVCCYAAIIMLFKIKYAVLPWASVSINTFMDQDLLQSMHGRFIRPHFSEYVHCKYVFTDMFGTVKEQQLSSGH